MKDREDSLRELLIERVPALRNKVFINHMPAEVVDGVLFKEGYSGATIDPEIKGWRKARFQIAVRDKQSNQKAAKARAWEIINALDIPGELRIPDGILIKHMRPLTEPIAYPISDGVNIEFSLNFQIIYVD